MPSWGCAATGSLISCARAASAGSTATHFIENNARYVEYCGAGECVGLYYTCINSYLTPETPPGADVVRGTPPSREPSSQKTLRRRGESAANSSLKIPNSLLGN
jgi:hypothetical protein